MSVGSGDGFVYASDLHLSELTWTDRPSLVGDAEFSLNQIKQLCIDRHLDLILAGDIFDKRRPDPRSVTSFARMVEELAERFLTVYFTQGNHDLERASPWPAVNNKAVWLNRQVCTIQGLRIYGLDWQPAESLEQALAEAPETDILVCHQAWREFMGESCPSDGQLAWVRSAPTVLTGDYHKSFVKAVNGYNGRVLQVYSNGSTSMQSINEDEVKYVWVYEAGQMDRVPLVTRPVWRLAIPTAEHLEVLAQTFPTPDDSVPARIRKPLVQVRFNNTIPDVARRITEIVGNTGHLFLQAVDERPGLPVVATTNIQASGQQLLRAILAEATRDDEWLNRAAMALIMSESTLVQEVARLRDEIQ